MDIYVIYEIFKIVKYSLAVEPFAIQLHINISQNIDFFITIRFRRIRCLVGIDGSWRRIFWSSRSLTKFKNKLLKGR
jgi:hypothetical protein